MHVLFESFLPARFSFPFLPSGQEAPSKTLLPICLFNVRECGLEQQKTRLSPAEDLDPILSGYRHPDT